MSGAARSGLRTSRQTVLTTPCGRNQKGHLKRRLGSAQPRRRTFATDILSFAHCVSAALRLPGFACSPSPALRAWADPRRCQPKFPRDRRYRSGQPNETPARSGRRPRRVDAIRKASASCLALLRRPPPALESPPSRRAAKRNAGTQRPKAAPRASRSAPQACRGSTPRRAATPPQPRCGHGRPEGGRSAGWSHLGCDHAGPSLRGPWMAPQA